VKKTAYILALSYIFSCFGIYQDTIVKNQVIKKGGQICDKRYELIRPVLDQFEDKFSVLDIGANLGYFSFKIAEEYNAVCTMIEGAKNGRMLYSNYASELEKMCDLNTHLKNVFFLKHYLTLKSIKELKRSEHFDLVLAFLVVHLMACDEKGGVVMSDFENYVNCILKLGNNVIFEMSVDVYPDQDKYMHDLCIKKGGVFLGEVRRCRNNTPTLGRFYWFKNSNKPTKTKVVSKNTFKKFNGVFPRNF